MYPVNPTDRLLEARFRRAEAEMSDLPRTQHAVMLVLAEAGRVHAYEIKSRLKGVVGHSSVYAALSALQAKGLARAEWAIPGEGSEGGGPPRKYFEITGAGRAALQAGAESVAHEGGATPAGETPS